MLLVSAALSALILAITCDSPSRPTPHPSAVSAPGADRRRRTGPRRRRLLAGDDHLYGRFALQDANGRFDPDRGIRQFIVGTGGAPLYEFAAVRPNSEFRASVWGVLKLTLRAEDYAWQFIPVGNGAADSGTGRCHEVEQKCGPDRADLCVQNA